MRKHARMTQPSFIVALLLVFLRAACAQEYPRTPEAGFLSADRYTNAFLGFSLPLPSDPDFHVAQVSQPGAWRSLFGVGREKGNAFLIISAQQMLPENAEHFMRVAPYILIHGKEFSKGVSHQKTSDSTEWKAMYLTVVGIHLLRFEIQSLDPSMFENLEHCVEETAFFDPAKAKEIAGPNAKPYNPALSLHSQQATKIVVRFINGLDGKPVRDKAVNIRLGSEKLSWRDTDSKGRIALDINSAQPRELAVMPDFVFDCRSTRESLLASTPKYSLDEIVSKGIVGDNLCGSATASPTPDVLILFVRPRTSKEKHEL